MSKNFTPGTHLLIDFFEAKNLQDTKHVLKALSESALACGATILETKLHSFGENCGITGVAILAESHITIHTWPEFNYAALDIFVCGSCDAHKSIPILQKFFEPKKTKIIEQKRGDLNRA